MPVLLFQCSRAMTYSQDTTNNQKPKEPPSVHRPKLRKRLVADPNTHNPKWILMNYTSIQNPWDSAKKTSKNQHPQTYGVPTQSQWAQVMATSRSILHYQPDRRFFDYRQHTISGKDQTKIYNHY